MKTHFLFVCFSVLVSSVATAGTVAKTPAKPRPRSVLVADYSPTTANYQRSQINFNGLIRHADSRQSKLEKRVQVKTATRAEKKGTKTKIARINFDDAEVKWKQKGTPPKVGTAAPPRLPSSGGQPGAFQVVMRPVKLKN